VSTFAPLKPQTHHPPLKVAADTWLVQQTQRAAIGPLHVYLNSLVIKGPEPIIVDTGTPANRDQWLKDVFSLVDPGDVRWIFLSHDDIDHAGNLEQVMAACPNAKVVVTWFFTERHGCSVEIPKERMLWVNDGDSWRAGDRTLRAVTPPLFDSPVTRGLFDEKTGVYWAVDAFATPLPRPMDDIAELDPMAWRGGLELFNRMNSPWFKLLDPDKFERHVDGIQSMDISVLASCHSPVIRGSKIDDAFSMIRAIPYGDPPPQPNQLDLDELMHCIATGKEYAWVPQPPPPTPGAGAPAP
jgi:flavorubredoxin